MVDLRIVEGPAPPEHLPALVLEERPGDDQATGRVADGRAAEVDHRPEPPVDDEHVGRVDAPCTLSTAGAR